MMNTCAGGGGLAGAADGRVDRHSLQHLRPRGKPLFLRILVYLVLVYLVATFSCASRLGGNIVFVY